MTAICECNVPAHPRAAVEEETLLLFFELCDALRQKHGYTEPQATEVAKLVIDTLSKVEDDELLQAKRVANRMRLQRRNAAIRAAARTGNAEVLATEWGITARQVYRIWGAR